MTAAQDFWGIAAYFNPMGYQRRRANYRVFREHLPIPLVTVETSHTGQFDLRAGDADLLIQLPCRDILWHKERLLNLALRRLPAACRYVVWLDCDVVFTRRDWVDGTRAALERHTLVQPFRTLRDIPRDAPLDAETGELRHSFAALWRDGTAPAEIFRTLGGSVTLGYSLGHAWAARRDLLDQHGFYDAFILGSGNKLMAGAATGKINDLVAAYHMNRWEAEHYLAWAHPLYESVQGRLGVVDGMLLHLWHGDPQNRNFKGRRAGFERFEFNPFLDIVGAENGCWSWNTDKPAMHAYVKSYFASRHEDG
jgi:hypothetical protein